MAFSLVPEHLLKKELEFEVKARSLQPETTVQSLRAQLRASMTLECSWQESFVVEDELLACQVRVEELECELESEGWFGAIPVRAKLASQLLHWASRLELLLTAPGLDVEAKGWASAAALKFKEALEKLKQVKSVKQIGASFQESSGLSLVLPKTGTMEHQRVVESAPASVTVSPKFPSNLRSETAESSNRGPSGLVSSAFAKLPHPLAATLQGFPTVDGLDVSALLSFLEESLKVKQYPGMTDAVLLELLVPYCLPPLKDRLLECLRRGVTFDAFHAQIIEFFIPVRVMERLRVERVYRPQAPAETLSCFVDGIRRVAEVLRLSLGERQLVDLILEGIKPDERSRLVFCQRPLSFADLERLSIVSRSVQDADAQREVMRGSRPQVPNSTLVPPPVVREPYGPPTQRERVPVCFGCGQRGHMRRECRQGQARRNPQ